VENSIFGAVGCDLEEGAQGTVVLTTQSSPQLAAWISPTLELAHFICQQTFLSEWSIGNT
jgi:hypothetical protein